MVKRMLVVVLVLFPLCFFAREGKGKTTYKQRFFQLSLFPPLSTESLARGPFVNHFVVGWLASKSDRLEGFSISGFHFVYGDSFGWSIGLANITTEMFKGWALSGLFNYSGRDFQGFQLATVNIADQSGSGFQLGAVNIGTEIYRGAQLGIVGVSMGKFEGAQVGGILYSKDITGVQVGLLNIAKNVKGVQFGIVNIADNSEASFGFLSMIQNGTHELLLNFDLTGFLDLSLKLGGRYLYSVYGYRYNIAGTQLGALLDNKSSSYYYGIGFKIPLRVLVFNMDVFMEFSDYIYKQGYSIRPMPTIATKIYVECPIIKKMLFVLGFHYTYWTKNDAYVNGKRVLVKISQLGIFSPFTGIQFGF